MKAGTDRHAAALELLAGLVCPDGRLWGKRATSPQWARARAVLSPKGPRRLFCTGPRGDAKTEDGAGAALAWGIHLADPLARGYAFAASEKQASQFMDSLRGFVLRTPGFLGAVELHQTRVIFRESGASFEVMSSDAASAWGLRPAFMVVDELAQWRETSGPKELWTAITSAVPKVPGCRLLVVTSAGSPAHFSYQIRQHAKRSRQWLLQETPGPLPWRTADDLEEERALRLPSEYARLVLNEWCEPEDHLALRSDVEAAAKDGLPRPLPYNPGFQYVLTVDIGWVNDNTVITVAHAETAPMRPFIDPAGLHWKQRASRVVVDHQIVHKPDPKTKTRVNLEEVFDEVEYVARKYDALVIADPIQTVDAVQRLQAKGIRAIHHAFTQANNGRLATTLHELLRNGRIDIPNDDDELIDELCHVKLKETAPGIIRMDTVGDRHDDRAVTIAMAAFHLLHVDIPDSSRALMVHPNVPVTPLETNARKIAALGSPEATAIVRRIDAQRRPVTLDEYLQRRGMTGRWPYSRAHR